MGGIICVNVFFVLKTYSGKQDLQEYWRYELTVHFMNNMNNKND